MNRRAILAAAAMAQAAEPKIRAAFWGTRHWHFSGKLKAIAAGNRAGWQDVELLAQARYVGDFAGLARAIRTRAPLEHSYDFKLSVQETILRASQEI